MKPTLQPGISHSFDVTVTADMSPPHLGEIVVLSTPRMIEFMEVASLEAARPHLDNNETSVGTRVDITHDAAARGGETVHVHAALSEKKRRRLTFAVVVRVGDRIIGQGTHERTVIDASRFG
jgi:predicted thioesterase